jgi:integrase
MPEVEPYQRRQRRRVLTDKMVAALARRRVTYFAPDPELVKHGVRVRSVGPGTFTVICRDPFGKQRWVKIGSTDAMTIAEAREIARVVIRRVEQGLPAFEPPKAKADSVAVVTAEWLKRYVEKNKLRSAGEYRRIINKYVLPVWGERVFTDLKRSDAARLLDYVEDEHGPAQADTVLTVVRMIGSWYRDREDDYASPFTKIKARTAPQNRARSRTLNDAELRRVWQAAGEAGQFGALVQLLLLTGQRYEKVRTMRWTDVSADGTWTIPTAPREKRNAGTLQLPPVALDIISAQPRFTGNPYIFAGNKGAKSFEQRHKRAFDKRSGTAGWRIHDLRRTARSLMSRAGVQSEHAERALGHTVGGVEAIYDRHDYRDEMADALRRLAALIARIADPPADNVVALHEAAAS